jgi:hypothetical protein
MRPGARRGARWMEIYHGICDTPPSPGSVAPKRQRERAHLRHRRLRVRGCQKMFVHDEESARKRCDIPTQVCSHAMLLAMPAIPLRADVTINIKRDRWAAVSGEEVASLYGAATPCSSVTPRSIRRFGPSIRDVRRHPGSPAWLTPAIGQAPAVILADMSDLLPVDRPPLTRHRRSELSSSGDPPTPPCARAER